MSLVRKVALNNLIMISERGLTILAGFVVSVWLIRYFGTERFGVYSLVFAWFTFLNVFTPNMIEQVVAREAVKFPDQMRKYLGAGVAIKIALALLGWAAGVGAAVFLGYPRDAVIYLAIALLGLAGNACYVLQVPHQIDLKLLRPALADGVSLMFYQVGRALLIVLKFGLLPFFWLYLLFRVIQLAAFFMLGLEKKEYRPDWNFSFNEIREILTASWVLLINNVFVMVISRIDQLLLYPAWGARAVGLYGSCANICDYLVMIPTVWYMTVFPLITRYLGESKDNFNRANHDSFKYLTMISVLVWIALAGFSKDFLQLLFGRDYVEAKDALFWLSTSMVVVFLYMGAFNVALSRGREKLWLLVNGLGALANVALNLVLIPRYSIAGAAFASFSAYLIQLMLCALVRDFRPDFMVMLKATFRPVLIGAAIVLASRFLELKLFYWAPVMGVIYLALLLLTGSMGKKDFDMFLKVVRPAEK
jgi:O-antigen/teichoic acid export membrane protein